MHESTVARASAFVCFGMHVCAAAWPSLSTAEASTTGAPPPECTPPTVGRAVSGTGLHTSVTLAAALEVIILHHPCSMAKTSSPHQQHSMSHSMSQSRNHSRGEHGHPSPNTSQPTPPPFLPSLACCETNPSFLYCNHLHSSTFEREPHQSTSKGSSPLLAPTSAVRTPSLHCDHGCRATQLVQPKSRRPLLT